MPTVSKLVETSKEFDDSPKREGVSDLTWSRLLRGVAVPTRADKRQLICRTLGWTYDSLERMLSGGKPELLDKKGSTRSSRGADHEERITQLENRIHEIECALGELVTRPPQSDRN